MKNVLTMLSGAWEEPGVIGTRIEINRNKITVLWRNSPVLETSFSLKEDAGGYELVLKKTGLRYVSASSDYAEVTRLAYVDERLEMSELFPVSGESASVLKKTGHSRFGNYVTADELLKQLRGTWKSRNNLFELVIKNDEMTLAGRKTRITVLKSKDPNAPADRYVIADRDPSMYELGGFSRFEYQNGRLVTRMLICDAPSEVIEFEKIR